MDVKIIDFKEDGDNSYVDYQVANLKQNQLEYLKNNLDDEVVIDKNLLNIRIFFKKELFPFASDTSKFKLNDFIAREEIEMNVFLSSFLEDM